MSTLDYYEILNISTDADEQTIRKAYRRLALQYHPDKNSSPDAADKFKDISEAYEILSDPEKRRIYDTRGSDVFHGNDEFEYNPFAGFQFHRPEDVFANVFSHMNAMNEHANFMNSFMMGGPPSPFGSFGGNSIFNQPLMGHSMMHDRVFGLHDFVAPPSIQQHQQRAQQLHQQLQQQRQRQQEFSSFSSSSSIPSNSYSKSVTTSTRSVNGVVETVKITKITDENGTTVTEEYGDGTTRINGIEQPATMSIENNNNVRLRNDLILTDYSDKSQIEQDVKQSVNQNNRDHQDFIDLKQRMLQEMEQERIRRDQWRRRNDLYLQQQYHHQQQQLQQMYYIQQQRQQQQQQHMFAFAAAAAAAAASNYFPYNPYTEDDDFDFQNIYFPSTPADPASNSYYNHLY